MAGFKTFADLDELTGAELNDYLMSQVVMRFADSTARSAALGSPDEGQVTYLDGVGFDWFNGTTWEPLVPVPAAFATVDRPLASAVPIGYSYFDTTLGWPLWSTGAAWVKADGT